VDKYEIVMFDFSKIALIFEIFEKMSQMKLHSYRPWQHRIHFVFIATACCYGNAVDSEMPSTISE